MPKFTVYEVQEYIEWCKFAHTVEAATEAEALELVKSGKGDRDPEPEGNYGEGDYGKSGYSTKDWSEAANNLDKDLYVAPSPPSA